MSCFVFNKPTMQRVGKTLWGLESDTEGCNGSVINRFQPSSFSGSQHAHLQDGDNNPYVLGLYLSVIILRQSTLEKPPKLSCLTQYTGLIFAPCKISMAASRSLTALFSGADDPLRSPRQERRETEKGHWLLTAPAQKRCSLFCSSPIGWNWPHDPR